MHRLASGLPLATQLQGAGWPQSARLFQLNTQLNGNELPDTYKRLSLTRVAATGTEQIDAAALKWLQSLAVKWARATEITPRAIYRHCQLPGQLALHLVACCAPMTSSSRTFPIIENKKTGFH
jgi:hypothetical protein